MVHVTYYTMVAIADCFFICSGRYSINREKDENSVRMVSQF